MERLKGGTGEENLRPVWEPGLRCGGGGEKLGSRIVESGKGSTVGEETSRGHHNLGGAKGSVVSRKGGTVAERGT